MARILLAEDDATNALIATRILEGAGHLVTRASNGLDALKLLQDGEYDAVVTDWMMPEMDGLDLVRKIHARFDPVPATIMVTCLSMPEARSHALESGADEFVAKPVTASELAGAVERAIARRRPTLLPMPRAFELPLAPPMVAQPEAPVAACPIVAIGANAGGPAALRVLLRSCGPAASEAAWIIAQNGPTEMLLGLVPLLARETTMRVSLAGDGSPVEPGSVILAPGGSHVRVSSSGRSIELLREPPINHVRPSADVLFASAAAAASSRSIAVVLTGMGCDGIEGAAHVRRARGRVVVVRPSARVASGMADGVVRSGYASALESLETVGAAITDMVASLRAPVVARAIAG